MFAWMRARVKTAAPFPWVGIVRIADALGNRADMNIAVINVPALLTVFCRSAAGEFGHGPLLLRLARVWSGGPRALQDSRPLNNARKVRNRLFVDGRRLRLAGLPLPLAGVNQVCEAVADQNLLISRSAANCASGSDAKSSGCHDANHRLATGPPSPRLGENGRAPGQSGHRREKHRAVQRADAQSWTRPMSSASETS